MATRKIRSKSGTFLGVRIVKPKTLAQKAKSAQTRRHNLMIGKTKPRKKRK